MARPRAAALLRDPTISPGHRRQNSWPLLSACGANILAPICRPHLSENLAEIAWIKELFPERASYLDVYHHAGLTGSAPFSAMAFIWMRRLRSPHQTGSALAHCPTSNLFLGSGLFRIFDARRTDRPVRVGLGTDVGAGTSFSQLQTLNEVA